MNTATVPNRDKEIARQRVNQFVRRFEESYRLLAYHAALPLVLTPELLNYLRNQFLRGQVPWLAEVDLLLSELCTPVGYELYAMDTAVRAYLLEEMHNDAALSSQRMQEVARLLLGYVRHLAQTNPFISKQELEAQQWAAMVYLDNQRENAVRQIVQAFQESRAIGGSRWQTEMARLSRITQELAPQLRAYPNLLEYAELITRFVAEPESVNPEPGKDSYQVLGETLEVPGQSVTYKLEIAHGKSSFPPLQVFEFGVVRVDRKGTIIDKTQEQGQYFREDLGNGITLDMVAIPGGSFLMGSPETEEGHSDSESPQHPVTVPAFFMGKYPVTQAQWQAVANLPQVDKKLDPEPSNFKGSDRPVEQVSWYDCVEFCARLSQYTGRDYRLPSEAEWEYACRAGTTTPFHFGETINTDLANYNGNYTYGEGHKGEYRKKTTPVGSFQVANPFGLFDMHGNVWEWCLDHWHDSYEGALSDGQAWLLDESKNENHYWLLRGGSWSYNPWDCRCASRSRPTPDPWSNYDGFRVVCGAAWTP
ncbi:formylglycine-generating enzyme family protein [Coleofasciculus chthonoplastes]|uniref:formylglycine-generating enzyme family protein n=1 Tax=Coleofasciculus chthonoplastes TaxID=64178 RepID=UPI0032F8F488